MHLFLKDQVTSDFSTPVLSDFVFHSVTRYIGFEYVRPCFIKYFIP